MPLLGEPTARSRCSSADATEAIELVVRREHLPELVNRVREREQLIAGDQRNSVVMVASSRFLISDSS